MIQKKMVTLNPGESAAVSFQITPTQPEVYQVTVNGLAGSFTVLPVLTLPFNMEITSIATTTDKYATAYWLMELACQVSNPHSVQVTRQIRCRWAFGSDDPNNPTKYRDRYWRGVAGQDPQIWLPLTLNPGQSIILTSPFYYLDGLQDYGGYEWNNMPLGMYSAGVPKKYWFRIIDELGNWSPVKSIGTA